MIDVFGEPSVYGAARGRHRWIRVPAVADFSWNDSGVLEVTPCPGVDRNLSRTSSRGSGSRSSCRRTGYEVLHASATENDAGVFGFCGHSGFGKSTLACALALRGHRLWADDALAVQVGSSEVVTTALPFRSKLRPESRAFFVSDGLPAVDPELAPAWSTGRLRALLRTRTPGSEWHEGRDRGSRVGRCRIARDAASVRHPFQAARRPARAGDPARVRQPRRVSSDLLRSACSPVRRRAPGLLDRLERTMRAVASGELTTVSCSDSRVATPARRGRGVRRSRTDAGSTRRQARARRDPRAATTTPCSRAAAPASARRTVPAPPSTAVAPATRSPGPAGAPFRHEAPPSHRARHRSRATRAARCRADRGGAPPRTREARRGESRAPPHLARSAAGISVSACSRSRTVFAFCRPWWAALSAIWNVRATSSRISTSCPSSTITSVAAESACQTADGWAPMPEMVV